MNIGVPASGEAQATGASTPGLLHRDPWGRERFIELRGPLVLGRNRQAGIHIRDPAISDFHCLFLPASVSAPSPAAATTWYLADLGSLNGTYLNGRRVSRPTALRQGDAIQAGRSQLIVALPAGIGPGYVPGRAAGDGS